MLSNSNFLQCPSSLTKFDLFFCNVRRFFPIFRRSVLRTWIDKKGSTRCRQEEMHLNNFTFLSNSNFLQIYQIFTNFGQFVKGDRQFSPIPSRVDQFSSFFFAFSSLIVNFHQFSPISINFHFLHKFSTKFTSFH